MGASTPLITPQAIFEQSVIRQARKIVSDHDHVLNPEYKLLHLGRRYRVPRCRYNKYKNSFIPVSIKLINEECV